ncbi:PREDICTED: protein phosphatase 2C-like domain-containing protein 1 [Nanorana parkeri]|uniref:protein phosphatase 2C-like domain-containing protein 1 n=1 Tax=Nanorana parkeri TaxID=125878 RepID=UPI000854488E|nr:PREDICTED: protein phosphatase 2C-like domain-containing protein 1 [Nanorana parkeri]
MKNSVLPTIVETLHTDVQNADAIEDHRSHINDLQFTCCICRELINPWDILRHKQHHKARSLLGYKTGDNPSVLPSLIIQKEQKISGIEASFEYKQREIQKINRSYEMLKEKLLLLTPNINRMNIASEAICQVINMDINNDIVRSIAACSERNASWQSDMEDSFVILNNYGQRKNTCFVGIFDGYHGKSAACTATVELPILLLDQMSRVDDSYTLTEEEKVFVSSFDSVFKEDYKQTEESFTTDRREAKYVNIEGIHVAHAKAFWRMDRMLRLGRGESSKSRWSGCTAVTCLLDGLTSDKTEAMHKSTQDRRRLGIIHIANIGNLKAVLCRNGKAYCLTRDHSTGNSLEMQRVLQCGGSVSANEDCGLIEGCSKVTRGLGFHGDPKLKSSIIPVPYTVSIPVYSTCQFLILASSGLWEVFNECEVVTMVQDLLAAFSVCSPIANPKDVISEHNLQEHNVEEKNNNLKASDCLADDGDKKSEVLNSLSDCETRTEMTNNVHICHTEEIHGETAAYVCQQIIKTAVLAGCQQNITVCLILLPGCGKVKH